MPIIRRWSGDGLSTGSVSAGVDDDSFSGVDGAPTLADDGSGASAHIVIPDAAGSNHVRWWPLPGSPLSSLAARVYLKMNGLGTTAQLIRGNGGGAERWTVRVVSTGRLRITGGASPVNGTVVLPTSGESIRIECTLSANTLTAYAYQGNTMVLIDSISSTITNGATEEIWFGKAGSTETTVDWRLDNLAVANDAQLIGPVSGGSFVSTHFRKNSSGVWVPQEVSIVGSD